MSGVESRLMARKARGFQPAARELILARRAVNLSLTRLRFVNAWRRGALIRPFARLSQPRFRKQVDGPGFSECSLAG